MWVCIGIYLKIVFIKYNGYKRRENFKGNYEIVKFYFL